MSPLSAEKCVNYSKYPECRAQGLCADGCREWKPDAAPAAAPLTSKRDVAWLLEIPGTSPPLYFGPNRCTGYLMDVTHDHMHATRFQRQEDAITTAEWLKLTNVNRDPDPPRNFVPVEHVWMQQVETRARPDDDGFGEHVWRCTKHRATQFPECPECAAEKTNLPHVSQDRFENDDGSES